ncbi:MAG: DUF1365 domain-containing protein [Acidobacteriota bacterium]|nr:MAG: DUF1365 domain-containing protein [Acidobacteriota bacterium]
MNSCLYSGWVRHRRFKPVLHSYRYRLYMAYFDLDELPKVFEGGRIWSAARPALVRFRREDHLGRPDRPLAESVRQLVVERTGREQRGPVRLLTLLRHAGYGFNPVSFYYCFSDDGAELQVLIAEVNNTPWGEQHCYVLEPATIVSTSRPVFRARNEKQFHVSPFMGMNLEYAWRVTAPGRRLFVHVENLEQERRFFDATLSLRRRELTPRSLARAVARHPLLPFKVIAAIHWQALKLWWRGVPVFTHPGAGVNSEDARVEHGR